MVVDANNEIVYMSKDDALTYGEGAELFREGFDRYHPQPKKKVDDELGLEIVEKPSIFAKYGVHCDPTKNSFHKSLHNQYEQRGTLSEKQINALRRSY